jgi:2-polyprenyl-6-hydroxyphenyl methylase/3-demethylubiquinone-9 3-methyltransferase
MTASSRPKDGEAGTAVGYHDTIAGAFAARYSANPRFAERLALWSATIDELVHPGSVVADLGCGPGHLAILAAKRASRVIGVDGSAQMLREAAAACERQGVSNIEFRQEMLDDLRATDLGPVDVILCSSVLEYLRDPSAFLHVCRESLRPGGHLAISVPNGASLYRLLEQASFRLFGRPRYLTHVRGVDSPARERERLCEAGFQPLRAVPFAAAPILSPLLRIAGAARFSDTLLLIVARRPADGAADAKPGK